MRIGEFSKLHGISSDTIRYYLDMELLVTEKQSGQYKFKKSDSKDLKRIIELKELHFSLIDIQKILTLQRLSGTNTTQFRKLYISFLEKKQKEVTIELSKYEKIDGSLTEKIKQL
ncbi:MAG: MerR family transcriptional regulator, partial [Firmicutes bacterium]|nr:MerR family transcriptional regulator [Bacillota bacterium]